MRGFTQKLMIRQYNYGNKSDSLAVVSSPRGSDLGIESMHYIEEKEAEEEVEVEVGVGVVVAATVIGVCLYRNPQIGANCMTALSNAKNSSIAQGAWNGLSKICGSAASLISKIIPEGVKNMVR